MGPPWRWRLWISEGCGAYCSAKKPFSTNLLPPDVPHTHSVCFFWLSVIMRWYRSAGIPHTIHGPWSLFCWSRSRSSPKTRAETTLSSVLSSPSSASTCCTTHPSPAWASSASSDAQTHFDTHNCHQCGNTVCAGCSEHRLPLPQFGILRPVRVCDACFFALPDLPATPNGPTPGPGRQTE